MWTTKTWSRILSILLIAQCCSVYGFSSVTETTTPSTRTNQWTLLPAAAVAQVAHVVEHVWTHRRSPQTFVPLKDLVNIYIPGPTPDVTIGCFVARPSSQPPTPTSPQHSSLLPVVLLIHEFFGLSVSIQEKAQGLADDLGCMVVAPDTYRGVSTNFIPRAIWLALTTPQERVNQDLDAVLQYLMTTTTDNNDDDDDDDFEEDPNQGQQIPTTSISTATIGPDSKVAVMGFCYGGGKALRYTLERRPKAATVVWYGQPVTDVAALAQLQAPLLGIFGNQDVQFPMALLEEFQSALMQAKVEHSIRIYENVGHAFWTSMDQIQKGEQPQTSAYRECISFLRQFLFSNDDKEDEDS